jgi:predicted nucleic acid-binding protein
LFSNVFITFRRFTPKLTFAEAEQYLVTTLQPLLAGHSSYPLYFEALALSRRHWLSWFDALIVAPAMECECTILCSEDVQDGQSFGGLKVPNPFAGLEQNL